MSAGEGRHGRRAGWARTRRTCPASNPLVRRGLLGCAAAALIGLAALLAGPSESRAEVLVSNFDQSATSGVFSLTANGIAQAFRTGSHAAGYSLDSIELATRDDIPAAEIGGLDVSVWTADADGVPVAKQFDLANPASILAATISGGKATGNFAVFAAPANATLAASTRYAVVATFSGESRRMWGTYSAAQTGAAGWSITDTSRHWETERARWTVVLDSYLIRVNGAPRSATGNANLSALTLADFSGGTDIALSPVFVSATTDYTADAGTAARVTVTPATADAGATVAYQDGGGNMLADADGNSANGHQVDLPLPENVIRIVVTAGDTTAARRYRLTVTRDAAASVAGVAVTSTAPRYRQESGANPRDVYGAGDVIEFTVSFSAAVTVDAAGGVPALVFSMGDERALGLQREAAYARGSGTTSLVFAYTVQEADSDDDGVFVLDATGTGGALRRNGGALSAAGGVVSTAIDAAARGTQSGHKVDGGRSGPYVTSLAVTSTPMVRRAGETEADTYGAGEAIEFTLVMSEPVTVTGAPHLQFGLGGANKGPPTPAAAAPPRWCSPIPWRRRTPTPTASTCRTARTTPGATAPWCSKPASASPPPTTPPTPTWSIRAGEPGAATGWTARRARPTRRRRAPPRSRASRRWGGR